MKWIEEISEKEIKEYLDKDARLIYDHCGLDVLMSLWQHFSSVAIYVSEKSLFELKKRYIKMKHDGRNTKEIALKLKCSERFVYDCLENKTDDRQQKLFDK